MVEVFVINVRVDVVIGILSGAIDTVINVGPDIIGVEESIPFC